MGFLDGLGRLVTGKPVFQPPDDDNLQRERYARSGDTNLGSQPKPQAQDSEEPMRYTGRKEVPEARIREWLECRTDNQNMVCEIRVRNDSPKQLQLSKLEFLGKILQLNQVLRPGQEFEIVAYNGQRPSHPSHAEARLYYKDETGDYFSAEHYVEFERLADGTFKVARIRFREVRDE